MPFSVPVRKPRGRENGERPGDYKIASRIINTVINPGDTFELEQYITGYGNILDAKLVMYFSPGTFEVNQSKIINGMGGNSDTGEFWWGNQESVIEHENTFSFRLYGASHPTWEGWEKSTPFFDLANDTLSTEQIIRSAPFHYKLKTKKNTKPGIYNLSFYFTFFNGESWVCVEEKVEFKVQSTFEKYNTALSALAAIALIVTIVGDGLAPLTKITHDIGVFVSKVRHGVPIELTKSEKP